MNVSNRMVVFIVVVAVVVIAGLAVLVERNSSNIDKIDMQLQTVEEEVHDLTLFVAELKEETPDEQAENAAISNAIRQVPEIKSILCEAFPNATACRVEG